MPLCSPKIPRGLVWDGTRASVMRSQQLTAYVSMQTKTWLYADVSLPEWMTELWDTENPLVMWQNSHISNMWQEIEIVFINEWVNKQMNTYINKNTWGRNRWNSEVLVTLSVFPTNFYYILIRVQRLQRREIGIEPDFYVDVKPSLSTKGKNITEITDRTSVHEAMFGLRCREKKKGRM